MKDITSVQLPLLLLCANLRAKTCGDNSQSFYYSRFNDFILVYFITLKRKRQPAKSNSELPPTQFFHQRSILGLMSCSNASLRFAKKARITCPRQSFFPAPPKLQSAGFKVDSRLRRRNNYSKSSTSEGIFFGFGCCHSCFVPLNRIR